jgi:3-oxosteroid 1-dehydrogenase
MSFDETVDVLVAGSGAAGLCAALAAADHGLDALLIDKGSLAGGGSSWSNGGIWVGDNTIARREGFADSREETIAYLHFLGAGHAVEENLLAYVDGSMRALDYFSARGIPFQIVHGLPDHYYDMAPGSKPQGRMIEVPLVSAYDLGPWRDKTEVSPYVSSIATFEEQMEWGGWANMKSWDQAQLSDRTASDMRGRGAGLVVHLLKAVLARGVPIRLETAATGLVTEKGAVTGVTVHHDGRDMRIGARRGVVLATGSYASNPRLAREFESYADWESFFPSTIDGDGMLMASEIGAAVRQIPDFMCHFLGYRVPPTWRSEPPYFIEAGTNVLSFPFSLVVNRYGRRFADESYFQAILNGLRQFDVWRHEHPNMPCFAIFDQNFADRYTFAGAAAGTPIPDWVARAADLPGLAAQLGVDGKQLTATVARFNVGARVGKDADFERGSAAWSRYYTGDLTHKPNANLGALERPPFYGVKLVVSGCSSAGLMTNGHGQAMHTRGHPIPGLYASGDVTAYLEQGAGFQAGTALGRGMTFSYLAVTHMVSCAGT